MKPGKRARRSLSRSRPKRLPASVRTTKKNPLYDREEIFQALTKLGHEPSYYLLDGKNQTLLALARCGADLVFNLTESYAGDDTMDKNIAAYLELLHIPYTGGGPQAL